MVIWEQDENGNLAQLGSTQVKDAYIDAAHDSLHIVGEQGFCVSISLVHTKDRASDMDKIRAGLRRKDQKLEL